MGYSTPIGGVTRSLNPNTTIHSTPFSILNDYVKLGNRMAIIQVPQTNKFVVWSSIPMGETFDQVLERISKEKSIAVKDLELIAGIIPNRQHNIAAIDLKKKFPNLTLIGPHGIKKEGLKLDYEIKREQGDTVIKGETIHKDLGNFEFILLEGHKNKEVLTFDKTTKTLYESDLLFNIPVNGINTDQYPKVNQNEGLGGWLSWSLNNESIVGKYIMTNSLFKKTDISKRGMQTVFNNWDIESIVPSHGNVFEKNGKQELFKVYKDYLSK